MKTNERPRNQPFDFLHHAGYLRFLCPLCDDFHTATNPRTNLARCFRCQRNFNPIDLIMIVDRTSFLEAVGQLEECLPPSTPTGK